MPALPGAPIRMRHSLSWCGSRKQASPTKGGKSIGGECWANDPNILLADSRARCTTCSAFGCDLMTTEACSPLDFSSPRV
jgi:hypothetical protein